jgi:polysaccharide export outer membrane protein
MTVANKNASRKTTTRPASGRLGFARSIAASVAASALLAGCGAVYYPAYAPSEQAFLIKDDERFPYDLQIVNLTIASAQEANVRWPYQPRSVPSVLQGSLVPSLSKAYAPARLAQADGPVVAYATSQSLRDGLPQDTISSYKVGKGDVLQIANVAGNDQNAINSQLQNTYLVDQQGRVFVPQLDYIDVLGKDIQQIRNEVLERMKKVFISPVALVNVEAFKSQNYSITGRSIRPVAAPVTMQPVTLREALLQVAANSTIYDEARVELVRNGRKYTVPYSRVAYEGAGATTIMKDGDQVIIRDPSGESARQAELRRTLEAVNLDNQRLDLQRQQISVQETQGLLSQQQLELTRNNDLRDAETLLLQQQRLEFDRERLAREAEAARRAEDTLSLAREREQREREAFSLQQARNEREDRAFELQRLRAEREAQTLELQSLREQRELDALALQRERGRREATTLDLQRQRLERETQEYALREGQFDLQRQDQILRERADARSRATLEISRLSTSDSLGALERDHVFVSGEVGQTTRMAMPFGSSLSLADALYEARGIDPVTGDPSGVHVVRTENAGSVRAKVYIFKLDGQNIANLSAATVFKMRPDDILYVTPQPVTNWNRTLTQLLGGTNALVGAASRTAL